MNLTLEALKLFRDTGEPLTINVTPLPQAPDGTHPYRLQRPGTDDTLMHGPGQPSHMVKLLRDIFTAYPHEVTIDGAPVSRTPMEQKAPVFIIPGQHNPAGKPPVPRVISGWHPKSVPLRHRIYAGGILCRPNQGHHLAGFTYHTPAGEGDHRWQFADPVTIFPIMWLTPDEVLQLSKDDYSKLLTDLWTRSATANSQEPGNIFAAANDRMRLQVQRTLQEAELPERHQGPVYNHVSTRSKATHNFRAIIVRENPLAFPADLDPPTASLADTLYRRTEGPVPVWFHQSAQELRDNTPSLKGLKFNQPHPSPEETVAVTDRIDAAYITSDGTQHPINMDFAAFGDAHNPKVLIASDAARRQDLDLAIPDAYRQSPDFEETPDKLLHYIATLVIQATKGRTAAFTHELEQLLESFNPASTRPEEALTVTSADGTLTITTKPNPDCQGCGQPRSKCGYAGRVCALHGDCGCVECLHSPADHLN